MIFHLLLFGPQDIVSRKEECRRRLEECPEPCRTDPEALRIRLKLPDGTQLDRFFLKSNRLKVSIQLRFLTVILC